MAGFQSWARVAASLTMNGRVRLRWMDRKTNPDAPEAHAPPTRLQGLAVEVLGEVV